MSDLLDYPIPSDRAIEPPPEWEELRQQCPVAKVRLASGGEATLLTRYDDVRAMLTDGRFGRVIPASGTGVGSQDDGGTFSNDPTGVMADEEQHQAWRRLVNATFTAKRVQALAPGITARAEQLIDDMLAAGGPADLVPALAFPLPVWVICELLGVPEDQRERFPYWSDTALSTTRYTQEEISAARQEFGAYMAALVEAKRAQPGDDLISELIALVDQNDPRLTAQTVIGTSMALLVAGHETTASHIAKMMALFLGDRSRWEQLVADPSLVRSAVEESLRFDPNAGFGMVRWVDEDIEVAGETVPAGTTVVCSLAAANRDEGTFEGAAEMDLGRRPNPHLSFGAGAYSCLGQSLARTELQIVLAALVRKVPSLELAVDVESVPRKEGLLVAGFDELPVKWGE